MTQEQKAQAYGNLLNEHTKYFNEINRIKAENLEPKKSHFNAISIKPKYLYFLPSWKVES